MECIFNPSVNPLGRLLNQPSRKNIWLIHIKGEKARNHNDMYEWQILLIQTIVFLSVHFYPKNNQVCHSLWQNDPSWVPRYCNCKWLLLPINFTHYKPRLLAPGLLITNSISTHPLCLKRCQQYTKCRKSFEPSQYPQTTLCCKRLSSSKNTAEWDHCDLDTNDSKTIFARYSGSW